MTIVSLATVAMVTYNSEKYVAEAIESVLCQTYKNLELVICDDCSTDNTWDIVQRYDDPRIRAFRNSENLGEYPNRNQALSLAQGEYLIYIDGDDILYPHGLEYMVQMLEGFPEAAMALARPWSEKIIYPKLVMPHEMFSSCFLGMPTLAMNFAHMLMKTDILHQVGGFDTRFKLGDQYIQLRIAEEYACVLISDGLAWWRRTPGQASERLTGEGRTYLEPLLYMDVFLNQQNNPLTPEETEIAKVNIIGGFTRAMFYLMLEGKIKYSLRLLIQAKLPPNVWKYVFIPSQRQYLKDVSAANPISDWRRNPLISQVGKR